ncbi:KipI family sensor histidine kinase inhibitor [Krasilnikovia cinnamomea]|uniref:KipI family sensor histidine kinase inhibitor n=1 Tax=Krasilnikovia cinnamomea TaxID=349313 RepID=A0A4Q7ZPG2_9ACTN|nr:5-oxoprolinase subunit PxpB [Krasilnikovia cinnamomea]RZU52413.1 KipI family sensor histidine kinase inhibitor [Krasilnikovia cinnamomea]
MTATSPRFLRCGREAVLIEVDGLDAALALYAALRTAELPGVVDLVPAARTVLVRLDPDVTSPGAVRAAVAGLPADRHDAADLGIVEIPVRYDGPDLAEVAAHTGLSEDAVVAAHTGTEWTVAFAGFAPGFAYLSGGDPRLAVPRRATPRTRIPAGSVGLAGRFSGVYPADSPGGWQLVGRTEVRVWDLDRPRPALLVPGVRVRFRAVDPCG